MKKDRKHNGEYRNVTINADGGNVIVGDVQNVGGMKTKNCTNSASANRNEICKSSETASNTNGEGVIAEQESKSEKLSPVEQSEVDKNKTEMCKIIWEMVLGTPGKVLGVCVIIAVAYLLLTGVIDIEDILKLIIEKITG